MKKVLSLFVVLALACVAANAEVIFQETLQTRRGSTYIEQILITPTTGDPYKAWPYPSQWYTGYDNKQTGDDHKVVEGNQFDNDYEKVESYGTSVRGKKINEQSTSTVGLYFGANKAAGKMYVKFAGALPTIPTGGAYLKFEICSPPDQGVAAGGNLNTMQVKINDALAEVPETTLPEATGITKEVMISLPAGELDSIKFAFDNVPAQKFISRFWIDTEAQQAIDNVNAEAVKAMKVIENGQLYIIRNGVKYNAAGAIVK